VTEPRRPTVLVVDDSPPILEIVCEVLADNYEVLFATGGRDALKQVEAEGPDLILLDVEMPDLDGFAVCEALKASPETALIPVIFLTGRDRELDEARGLELGAIDYITKPISPPILRARVRNHIELKKYRDELAGLARKDGLTGIANRRCLDETLVREWGRAARAGQPLSLVMVDIDLFKRFNDHFGHVAGDLCLRRVAEALGQAVLRTGDLVARYGGEEFACLLPNTDASGALVIARRAMESVAATAIPAAAAGSRVTVSMGVATLLPRHGQPPEDLVVAADRFLYEAKHQGRDRIVDAGAVDGGLRVTTAAREASAESAEPSGTAGRDTPGSGIPR
jgi:diguanylate cyclase (GGDEF)-like protein